MNNTFALIDRFIISRKELLEKGETLYVQVNDGYLSIRNEIDEATNSQKTVTYFSEFDGVLQVSMKEVFEKGVKNEGNDS
ncbi:hypothetical protein ACFSFY_00185 [Sporosarcina siberiensis]|uniref:Uncharacterized protein n=1 Tax=Sporosarcina siberiensis TaxID=1365606 RepID=A0ABW4SC09_9BACL